MKKTFTLVDVPVEKNRIRDIHLKNHGLLRGAAAPVDFPDRLRVGIDDGVRGCHLFIDFMYPMGTDEPVETQEHENGFMFVGKRSGRIIRLEMRLPPGTSSGKVNLNFVATMKRLAQMQNDARELPSSSRPPRRIAHYGALSELLPEMAPMIEKKLEELRSDGNAS